MVIAHIGSILEDEFEWLTLTSDEQTKDESLKTFLYKSHLGILGLCKFVTDIDNLELVTISEYGEEMYRIRTLITEALNEVFQDSPTFRTGDIGLKIMLEKPLSIHVNNYTEYAPPPDVDEEEKHGKIVYKKKVKP